MRCAERLLVENRGDSAIHLLLPVKLGNALPETVLIGVLLVALHAPLQPMFACGASLPIDSSRRRARPKNRRNAAGCHGLAMRRNPNAQGRAPQRERRDKPNRTTLFDDGSGCGT